MGNSEGGKAHHAKPLGRMVANFANLEMVIAWLANLLIGRDQVIGRIVTAKMSFSNTVAVVGALARYQMTGAVLEELLALLKRAPVLEQKRNGLTHCVWMLGDDQDPESIGRLKFKISSKKGYVEEYEDLPLKEIDAVADGIATLRNDIMGWLDKAAEASDEMKARMSEPPSAE